MIHIRTPAEIDRIAEGGRIIGRLFAELEERIVPGVSTMDVNQVADEFIRSHDDAIPAFKGLYGFPASVCISVNEEVVHGIPKAERVLVEGDIVTVDCGVKLNGWYSDSANTFSVGEIDSESQRLLDATRGSLAAAIEASVVGNHIGDIGVAVMEAVAGEKLGIVRDLVGHGIGRELHEDPQVPNVGRAGFGPKLRPGMVLAIEPMIALGTDQIRTLDDRWTVVTADGTRAAHFEHTVAITDSGPRILTGAEATLSSSA